MKLYHRVSRHYYLKCCNKRFQRGLRWALSLKPGNLINDCSGFNVVIKTIEPVIYSHNKGWYVYDVRFTTEPIGGSCSLRHCGVDVPLSAEQITKETIEFYNKCPQYCSKELIYAIEHGLSLCDSRGVRLVS